MKLPPYFMPTPMIINRVEIIEKTYFVYASLNAEIGWFGRIKKPISYCVFRKDNEDWYDQYGFAVYLSDYRQLNAAVRRFEWEKDKSKHELLHPRP